MGYDMFFLDNAKLMFNILFIFCRKGILQSIFGRSILDKIDIVFSFQQGNIFMKTLRHNITFVKKKF